MNIPFLIAAALSIFGLGIFIGNILCEIEEWELGCTLAFSRIIGFGMFIVCGIVAYILH
jgi:hypothetical protein